MKQLNNEQVLDILSVYRNYRGFENRVEEMRLKYEQGRCTFEEYDSTCQRWDAEWECFYNSCKHFDTVLRLEHSTFYDLLNAMVKFNATDLMVARTLELLKVCEFEKGGDN